MGQGEKLGNLTEMGKSSSGPLMARGTLRGWRMSRDGNGAGAAKEGNGES